MSARCARSSFRLKPPLVSVVITNYNYGRFLRDAAESVREQTYAEIECIIVDDCSTDESARVLDEIERDWPDVIIRRLETNAGQSAATLEGMSLAHGDYVLFLDSDDVLFPTCVAHHLAVHMSSRQAVGFTCCDAVQIVGERMVVARNGNVSASFVRLPARRRLTSPTALATLALQGIDLPPIAPESVRHVPWTNTEWPWSTTSSMLFRREALDLVSGAAGLRSLRIATDNFLAHFINHLTGSLLIDAQLVGYRIHGNNGFNKRAALDGFICHQRVDEHHQTVRHVILNDLITRFGHFSLNMTDPKRIFEICAMLDEPDPESWLPRWASHSHFARLLVEQRDHLEALVGRATLAKWMIRARVPLWRLWRRAATREIEISEGTVKGSSREPMRWL